MIEVNDDKGEKITFLILWSSILVLIIWVIVYSEMSKREIKSDYGITEGWVVKYSDNDKSVEGSGRTITYSYKVDSRTYTRATQTNLKILECSESISEDCARKRYWVIYSKKKHGKSLVNLKIEIQGIEKPKFPETIKDFI